ncbi:hypothetical protein OPV22_032802 [Ensete ventricosum]|uniref:Uncharacterized protein n=1 Tax=Ensete ventricosum TaxID=4639 RepID=A0AAV8P2N7_ENSVE|nr:hypothetical protein OPV22_032802 [Ensete ventricosum]
MSEIHSHFGGRLRAFASPCLRACAAQLYLPWMSEIHPHWPPESFRLARLESLCCSILLWMSETVLHI